MKHKILKKILGILNYKLIDKNYFKNNRIIGSNSTLNLDKFLEFIFKNKIKQLIQVGANDGKRFDTLNKFIKKYKTSSILIEPIKSNFDDLQKSYKKFKFVKLENKAISVNNEINFLYKVNEKFLNMYDNHVPGITSFNKKHLINHGISNKHISKEIVNSSSIKEIINEHKLTKLDLLFIDTEGYDGKIVLDFLKNKTFNPIIIFEYIHIDNKVFQNVIKKLLSSKYKFFPINENIVCLPKNKFFKI
jgi:FkbM family methyltransferase